MRIPRRKTLVARRPWSSLGTPPSAVRGRESCVSAVKIGDIFNKTGTSHRCISRRQTRERGTLGQQSKRCSFYPDGSSGTA